MISTSQQLPERSSSHQARIGSRTFLLTSDDDYLGNVGSDFEPDMCKLFQHLIKPTHNVLDIGANIGCTTLLFGQIAKEVDSFEPSPSTFRYLDLNVRDSRLRNVNLHNVGLGANEERLTLTFAPSNRSGGYVSNRTQASTGHTVETIEIRRGDDFVGSKRVDFIKIDVEGFERNVLEGLRQVIEKNHPIIVLELNHWCLNAFQRISIPDFFDFLLQLFPILYAVDGDKFADLHDPDERYSVMYQHIVRFRYPNLVGAFNEQQVQDFVRNYSRELISDSGAGTSELDAAISARDTAISERDTAISERDTAISERDTAISERDAAISERDIAISERDTAISERDVAIYARDALLNSNSWKLTKPLRLIRRLLSPP